MTSNNCSTPIEIHPWKPWLPEGSRVMFLGSFPPAKKRHAMDFYYPNRTNDFYRVMGLIFHDDADYFIDKEHRGYKEAEIKNMLASEGIALSDTGLKIRRLAGNASDKFLEIVEPVNLDEIIEKLPHLERIATTGLKAAQTLAQITGTAIPDIGACTIWERADGRKIEIWRVPSTSRAYPLAVEKKAEVYRKFLAGKCPGLI